MTLSQLVDLLFRPPPGPPEELRQARRETIRDVVRGRQAARAYQEAVVAQRDILSRIGDVSSLVREEIGTTWHEGMPDRRKRDDAAWHGAHDRRRPA